MRNHLFKLLLFLGILVSSAYSSLANHASGGDITYQYLGNDSFLVTVEYYRECNGVGIGTNVITITPGTLASYTISTHLLIVKDITPVSSSTPTRCSNISSTFPYGIQKVIFTGKFKADPTICNYVISVTECCLSAAITTGAAGDYYYNESNLDICDAGFHNSPVFNSDPLLITCQGACTSLSQNAIANSGDSLSYSLTDPLNGPGMPISYIAPYSKNAPVYFSGNQNDSFEVPSCNGFHLDHVTGEINFKPLKTELTLVCIKVTQWRKNQFGQYKNIGSVTRQTTYIIMDCPTNHTPIIAGFDGGKSYTAFICANQKINFKIPAFDLDTTDSVKIVWDNGIPNASFTVSKSGKWQMGTLTWSPTSKDWRVAPYNFVVTATDNASPVPGKIQQVFSIYLLKDSFPNISFSTKNITCGTYSLTVSGDTSSKFKYSWQFDNQGPSSQNKSTSYQFTSAGQHIIDLLVTSDAGCAKNVIDTITTSSLPYPKSAFSLTNTCSDMNIGLINTSTPPNGQSVTYLWKFGDGTTSTFMAPVKSYQKQGSYTIWLITKGDSGCRDSVNKTVQISQGPTAKMSSIVNNCLGLASVFSDSSVFYKTDSIKSLQWNFGDNGTSTQSKPSHTYASAGVYKVVIKVQSKSGCVDSSYKPITIFPLPNAGFTAKSLGNLVYSFFATDQALLKYEWDFGDKTTDTGRNLNHTFGVKNTYTVILKTTNKNTCINTNTEDIDVTATGINNSSQESNLNLKLSPNPFRENFSFSYTLKNQTQIKISISDISGRTLFTIANELQNEGPHSYTINSNEYILKPGVYLLNIENEGQHMSKEIVKQ